jgi:hypothetical protein
LNFARVFWYSGADTDDDDAEIAAAGDDDHDHRQAGTGKTTMLARGGSTIIVTMMVLPVPGACELETYAALELMLKWAFGEPTWVRTAEYPMANAAAISIPFAT